MQRLPPTHPHCSSVAILAVSVRSFARLLAQPIFGWGVVPLDMITLQWRWGMVSRWWYFVFNEATPSVKAGPHFYYLAEILGWERVFLVVALKSRINLTHMQQNIDSESD